jgi:exosortase/archaeosortase family protein
MTNRDWGIIALLLILAVFIWIQDLSWLSAASDSLPILATLPLFVWLGWPWRFIPSQTSLSNGGLLLSMIGFLLGGISGSTLLLALGWASLLWSWLRVRLEAVSRQNVKRLMILPIMAFPWIMLDGQMIGWWFRISGTWVAGNIFSAFGFNVVQEGTRLLVHGLPIEVSAACAGLNTLQSMIIAGSALAYVILGNHPAYWFNLLFLVILSWMANTLRIITICWAAVTFSPAFAAGFFHQWGGWLVLFLMFSLSYVLFSLQRTLFCRPAEV